MDVVAKLKGLLPKGISNGLAFRAESIARDPKKIRVAVVLLEGAQVVDKLDDTRELHMRVVRIEVVEDDADVLMVRSIMRSATERRTGQHPIPETMADDERAAFGAALERDAEDREEAARRHPRLTADLLRHGSGVFTSHGAAGGDPDPASYGLSQVDGDDVDLDQDPANTDQEDALEDEAAERRAEDEA